MAYTVYNNDGSVLVSIPNNQTDDVTTSITLVGKNVNNYGEIINNNFVKLLTSFAHTTSPSSEQIGQLWYDKNTRKLKVYDGQSWKPTYQSQVSGTSPSGPAEGDFWYDSSNRQFRVYANGEWRLVGPAVSFLDGTYGIEPPNMVSVVDYITTLTQKVGIVYSATRPMMMLSTTTFTANTATANYYLNTNTHKIVYSGTTVLSTLTVVKDLRVEGDIIVNGSSLAPYRGFTAAYNSGWLGPFTSTYTVTNNFVRLELLPALFSTSSTVTNLLSEVKVHLTSGTYTTTEVRHFILQELVPGVRAWEAYEKYDKSTEYTNIVQTWTNVVRII